MDLALTEIDGGYDIVDFEQGLRTSVLISLFTDRQVEPEEIPPGVLENRGHFSDIFEDLNIGSRLWLLDRAKILNETAVAAKDYINEALSWMIEDEIVEEVQVSTFFEGEGLSCQIALSANGGTFNFKFSDILNRELSRDAI